MIPEFGHFALILALCMACTQALFPLLGTLTNKPEWLNLARPIAYGQAYFVFLSFIALMYAFISNDFSVAYVAENSNSHLPLFYRVTAVWGAHEGSLLLWLTVLALWTIAVATFSKSLPNDAIARVLAVLALISIGFLLFILTTSDPFSRFLPNHPLDGQDLNPLLQDPGLATHPPMLYMGYVGFAVAFAFAISGLLSGRLDAAWVRWTRPWTLAAWCFLTLGITLGSWWSYRVLGWGGWWFWDPVENAAFLPWLTGTALIHSLAVCEKRGAFKSWTILLAIVAFSLSLIGTFLVRSGILTSVHAFAVDPSRGAYMLEFLTCVIGGSLLLYGWRAAALQGSSNFQLLSRETMLLSNNVILVVAMVTVLLGTLYPLVMQALNLGKISVGPPYFNAVFIPLFLPLLFIMGIGPLCQWREMPIVELVKKIRWLFLTCIALGIILPLIFAGQLKISVILGVTLALWIIATVSSEFFKRLQAFDNWRVGLTKLPRSQIGMLIAHIGLAICVIGVTLTSAYSTERDVRMSPGDNMIVGKYQYYFRGLAQLNGANYQALQADFIVARHNKLVSELQPEKRYYAIDNMSTSIPAIHSNLFRDVYVVLGEPLTNNAWAVRIYDKPFVRWIWAGGLFMVLGGIVALTDRRYRLTNQKPKKVSEER